MKSLDVNKKSFLQELDEAVAKFDMLKHPFYQLWSQGKLTLPILQEYAKQYYAHVRAFPAYVSGVHSHCDDLDVRRLLLENLMEEEHGVDNHPELWLRFADVLKISRNDVGSTELLPSTVASVNALKKITRHDNFLAGLAALYAYESQIPEVSRTKREGLKEFYGIDDPRGVSFFSVHEVADIEHRQVERDILQQHCTTPELREEVLKAAAEGAKALWQFLDGVYAAYVGKSADGKMTCATPALN